MEPFRYFHSNSARNEMFFFSSPRFNTWEKMCWGASVKSSKYVFPQEKKTAVKTIQPLLLLSWSSCPQIETLAHVSLNNFNRIKREKKDFKRCCVSVELWCRSQSECLSNVCGRGHFVSEASLLKVREGKVKKKLSPYIAHTSSCFDKRHRFRHSNILALKNDPWEIKTKHRAW